jgi:hypothetical protein
MARLVIAFIALCAASLCPRSISAQHAEVVEPAGQPPEYKVAFWYDRDRPGETFHHQAYDLRKGEYDAKAVDAWLATMKSDFPRYQAFVRDVRLAELQGENDAQKLRRVVQAELERVVMLRLPPGTLSTLSEIGQRAPSATRPVEVRSSMTHPPGSPGLGSNPANRSPFPYPYPRPHP